MLREPLVRALNMVLTCLMRPLEGVAYVEARMSQASLDVFALAIKGIIVW